jgi:hypothetical protein
MGFRSFVTLDYQAYFYWKENLVSLLPRLTVVPNDTSHRNSSNAATYVIQLVSRMYMQWDVWV